MMTPEDYITCKETIEHLSKELADAQAEIENKQYSITCDSERIQLLCETVEEQRAEIEQYKMGKISPADYYSMAEAETELCNEIAALRAEIEHLKARNVILESAISDITEEQSALCAEGQSTTELVAERDKLIEQMREEISRLKRCCNCEYANHKFEVCEHPDNEPETFMDGVCDLWSHNI